MEKLAFVFAGAGHSYVGMGRDLYEEFPETRPIFDEVSDLTKTNIAQVCFEGSGHLLGRYREGMFAQLALGLACYQIVSLRGGRPDFFCGPCAGQIIGWIHPYSRLS